MRIGIDARMLGPEQGGIGRYIQQLTKNIADIFCHPRENGDPENIAELDSRFRGNDTANFEFVISTEAKRSGEIPPATPKGSFDSPDQNGLAQDDKFNPISKLINAGVEFVIFLRKNNWDLVPESPNIKKVLTDIPWYGWKEQIILPKIIKLEKVDLMHFPHWNIPVFYNKPFVVTIHDLLLLRYPTRQASTLGPVKYFFKNLAYRAVLNHAIKKAKQIITPSEFTKNDIIKTFKIPAEKITAIHLAPTKVDSRLTIDYGNFQTIADKYKITKLYILYVGVAYPHKNLEGLIEAWKMFCAEHGNGYQLVLAGRKNYFYERLEKSLPPPLNLPLGQGETTSVIFTGFVPDEELPALYQNAVLYIFPSFYEGFGLPPLEAMQWGVPVVSSNAACLPEILGNAAHYFDPHDFQAINRAIWSGISDENLRRTLKLNAEKLIHNYDWKKTAQSTLGVYGKVI
jgi:glycosyltransferase involved in cell wall biosynthesis